MLTPFCAISTGAVNDQPMSCCQRNVLNTAQPACRSSVLANVAAESVDWSKSSFLATMSHEIQTACNGIIPMNTLYWTRPRGRSSRTMCRPHRCPAQRCCHSFPTFWTCQRYVSLSLRTCNRRLLHPLEAHACDGKRMLSERRMSTVSRGICAAASQFGHSGHVKGTAIRYSTFTPNERLLPFVLAYDALEEERFSRRGHAP